MLAVSPSHLRVQHSSTMHLNDEPYRRKAPRCYSLRNYFTIISYLHWAVTFTFAFLQIFTYLTKNIYNLYHYIRSVCARSILKLQQSFCYAMMLLSWAEARSFAWLIFPSPVFNEFQKCQKSAGLLRNRETFCWLNTNIWTLPSPTADRLYNSARKRKAISPSPLYHTPQLQSRLLRRPGEPRESPSMSSLRRCKLSKLY